MHVCVGDRITPTHNCSCDIGHNHTARDHREDIADRGSWIDNDSDYGVMG